MERNEILSKVKDGKLVDQTTDILEEENGIKVITKYTVNEDGTHSATCSKCNEKRTENCTFQDGKCSVCGYTQPSTGGDKTCEHSFENYKDKNNTKYDLIKIINVTLSCNINGQNIEYSLSDYILNYNLLFKE